MERDTRGLLVSVVVPTYNRETFLQRAIGSVFQQSYDDWELLVVDDGSTDGTERYLRALPPGRVRVIAHRHCANPAKLRNLGIAQARGRYVAFLDSDDVWKPEKLEIQMASLLEHPTCRWSYTAYDRIDQHGNPLPFPPGRVWRPYGGWMFGALVAVDAYVATPTVVAERRFLQDIGGFDESLAFVEDYDAWLRLAMRSEACIVALPLASVRDHPGNTGKGRIEVLECLVAVYAKLLASAPEGIRSLCRRQYIGAVAQLAGRLGADGRYVSALRRLLQVSRSGAVVPAWWLGLLKACVRPAFPALGLKGYRAVRAWIQKAPRGR